MQPSITAFLIPSFASWLRSRIGQEEDCIGILSAKKLPSSQYELAAVAPALTDGQTVQLRFSTQWRNSVISYKSRQSMLLFEVSFVAILLLASGSVTAAPAQSSGAEHALQVSVNQVDGKYTIAMPGSSSYALRAGVGVEVDGKWLHASDYPRHAVEHSQVQGYLGDATDWQVTYSGLVGQPDLIYHLRGYSGGPFGDIQVTVRNSTGKTIHVESIRSLEAMEGPIIDLAGPAIDNRVLSDSFSEDRPAITIRNFADAEKQMHRAVGSQLIYNRRSHQSLFLGALTSDRFLTILRLHLAAPSGNAPRPTTYEVDSTGTTEMAKENSLEHSSAEDQVELSVPISPGAELPSEQMLFGLSTDYHRQLETYGSLIGRIHHAKISAPALMGWWSWTAYYFGLNEGAALTNAEWEAQHLKSLGYNIFHIDEGYQYARGEYITPNATLFPQGLAGLEYKVRGLGLVPAIWTAPFEISERSWVYQNHPDWLVKNAKGQPIHAGTVVDNKDQLFVLDTTNPEAQKYLRKTYSTLVDEWGIRSIKMDFMDDSLIEGYYYKPNTTALEAQRIGLKIIRDTVGDDVYLDKDGSPMLNPVGYVDYGRISQDTGHTFDASKEAAPGIAARYYMNRTFFVTDPDAFTVSTQTIDDQSWHESKKPATLDEARVSIALAAVSGGMFEIGDALPSLSKAPERLALIQNLDLIRMIRLGRASLPLDLMNFAIEDEQPSIFFLKEDDRQSILTIFNWTNKEKDRSIDLTIAGLPATGQYQVTDVLDNGEIPAPGARLTFHQSPHSVRVLKIIDAHIPAVAPTIITDHPSDGRAGLMLKFVAHSRGSGAVISYHWDLGDGVTLEGSEVRHIYTEPGEYEVHLTGTSVGSPDAHDDFRLRISGYMPTTFDPQSIKRLQPAR
jgi:alpha-galactosidase